MKKYIQNGLYELRMEYNGNIYRVFFIFDEDKNRGAFQWFSKEDTENTGKGNRKGIENNGGIL